MNSNATNMFDIVEVKESEKLSEVNRLLSSGWKLLTTYPFTPYAGEPQNCSLCYSLGRPASVRPLPKPEVE